VLALALVATALLAGCESGVPDEATGGQPTTVAVVARVHSSKSAKPTGPSPLHVERVRALDIAVHGAPDRTSACRATMCLDLGSSQAEGELVLSGLGRGKYYIGFAARDSGSAVLAEGGCNYWLAPGSTTQIDVDLGPAGLQLAGSTDGCHHTTEVVPTLTVESLVVDPVQAMAGESLHVRMTVLNAGTQPIAGLTPMLDFTRVGGDAGGDFVVGTPTCTLGGSGPWTLAAGARATFDFPVTVSGGPQPGALNVRGSLAVEDADAVPGPSGWLEVLPSLRLQAGTWQAPALVSQGQTFLSTVVLSNSGARPLEQMTATLTLGSGVTATPMAGNPTSVPAGGSAVLRFQVAVAATAPPAANVAQLAVDGRELLGGTAVTYQAALSPSTTVQTPPALSVASWVQPAQVLQGSSFNATVSVQNAGQARARVTSSVLAFNRAGVTVTPSGANPVVLPSGVSTYVYAVNVSPTAPTGPVTATFSLDTLDVNTGLALPGVTRGLLPPLDVQAPTSLSIVGVTNGQFSRGQTGGVLQATVRNSGPAMVQLTSAQLVFAAVGVTAAVQSGLPSSLGPGATTTLSFLLSIDPAAALGPADCNCTVRGNTPLQEVSAHAYVTNIARIQKRAALALGDVALASPSGIAWAGTSPTTVEVLIHNGDSYTANALVSAASLSFATPGASVTADYVVTAPAGLTSVSVPGGGQGSLRFQVRATADALKYQTVTVTAQTTVRDANTGVSSTQTGVSTWVVRIAARNVLGQPDLRSNLPNRGATTSAVSLLRPRGVAMSGGPSIAVADTDNNRVLIYPQAGVATPTAAIGQPDLGSATPGSGPNGLRSPAGVAMYFDTLAIADSGNNRVLLYNSLPAANFASADAVLGQPNLISNTALPPSAASLNNPSGVAFLELPDGPRLAVADTGNNRVLVFRTSPWPGPYRWTTGAPAEQVLGQPDFVSSGSGTGPAQLALPVGLAALYDQLAVVDLGRSWVSLFRGLSSLSSTGASVTAVTGGNPNSTILRGVAFPLRQLVVGDETGNRAFVYDNPVSDSGVTAPRDVLGQRRLDASSTGANATVTGVADEFSLYWPGGCAGFRGLGGQFFVADRGNNRVLEFGNGPPPGPAVCQSTLDSGVTSTSKQFRFDFDAQVVDANGGDLTNNFSLAGTVTATDGTGSFPLTVDTTNSYLVQGATGGAGSSLFIGVKRAGFPDGDADFRFVPGATHTVTVSGFGATAASADAHTFTRQFTVRSTIGDLVPLGINPKGYAEYRNPKDGSELIEIPAGTFRMGTTTAEAQAISATYGWYPSFEMSQHQVSLSRYFIGKYEVTNAQYGQFLAATADPRGPTVHQGHHPDEVTNKDHTPTSWDGTGITMWSPAANMPVVNVDWYDAYAYCAWAGLKLPTEAQWECAARGRDGRTYPWGNAAPDAGGFYRANCNPSQTWPPDGSDGFVYCAPVGRFGETAAAPQADGRSPFGALDMAGNVWEWNNDRGAYYPNQSLYLDPLGDVGQSARLIRGGGWSDDGGAYSLRAAYRFYHFNPTSRYYGFGFRVSR
jgi:formylglycine-generating enzyme required for sulfatase activity